MSKRSSFVLVLVATLLVGLVLAPHALAADPIMPLSEVTPGMQGTAKTVVKGADIVTFDVEIVDVVPQFDLYGALNSLIIIKVSGPVIDETGGLVYGMSGSPVYVDGKVVGAIAWRLGEDRTVGGVTPIESMLNVGASSLAYGEVRRLVRPISLGDKNFSAFALARSEEEARAIARTNADVLVAHPLSLVVSYGGVTSQRTKSFIEASLGRFGLKAVPGGGRVALSTPPMEPGSSAGVGLLTGDVSLFGMGTMTYIDGINFWAFGHPMLYKGDVNFPLTGGYIHTVVPGVDAYKLGSVLDVVGTIRQDRGAAVAGTLGEMPDVVPVSSDITETGSGMSLSLDATSTADKDWLSFLAMIVPWENFDRLLDEIGRGTSKVRFTITADGLADPVTRENYFFSESDIGLVSSFELAEALDLLLYNELKKVKVVDVDYEAEVVKERKTARIEEATVPSMQPLLANSGKLDASIAASVASDLLPGETLDVQVEYTPWDEDLYYGGEKETVTVPLEIPVDFPPGPATLLVHGAGWGWESGFGMAGATIDEVVSDFENRDKNNEIIVELLPEGVEPPLPPFEDPFPFMFGAGGASTGSLANGTGAETEFTEAKAKYATDYVIEGQGEAEVLIGWPVDFTDVSSDYWAYDSIIDLGERGVLFGYPEGDFRPDDPVLRIEFAAIMARILGLEPLYEPTIDFADVSPDSWAYGEINAVVAADLFDGVGGGLFDPFSPASRSQALAVIVRALGEEAAASALTEVEVEEVLAGFADGSDVPQWARNYWAHLILLGIVNGYPDGSLRPNVPVTRAQVAALLVNSGL